MLLNELIKESCMKRKRQMKGKKVRKKGRAKWRVSIKMSNK